MPGIAAQLQRERKQFWHFHC